MLYLSDSIMTRAALTHADAIFKYPKVVDCVQSRELLRHLVTDFPLHTKYCLFVTIPPVFSEISWIRKYQTKVIRFHLKRVQDTPLTMTVIALCKTWSVELPSLYFDATRICSRTSLEESKNDNYWKTRIHFHRITYVTEIMLYIVPKQKPTKQIKQKQCDKITIISSKQNLATDEPADNAVNKHHQSSQVPRFM